MSPKSGKIWGKFGIDIFRTFKFITRLSKYDFWIPREISDWRRYFFLQNIFFFEMKKNIGKIFFWKKWDFFWKKRFWYFSQLKSHLKSIFGKSILNDFSIEKNLKICFCKKNLIFSQNIFSRDFFSFRKKICFEKKIPISIRNFLKIPKIALRKSCDKFKAVKNKESGFFYKFYQILVMC